MLALAENRDQWRRLADDPELVWTVGADEILRWSSPVLHFRRTATRDVEVGGQAIRAGDKVVIWYVSANFDEEVFADPLRFDVGRRPNPHVTFGGGGPHFCLGAHLARLEVQVMFDELLPRLADIELLGPAERMRTNFTNALKRMPVRVAEA
jgi:cholest-4-en-3-one 26-monooxygenase